MWPWGSTAARWGRGGLDFLPTSICVVQGGPVNGLMPQFPPLQARSTLILLTVMAIKYLTSNRYLKNLLLLPVKLMTVNEENKIHCPVAIRQICAPSPSENPIVNNCGGVE